MPGVSLSLGLALALTLALTGAPESEPAAEPPPPVMVPPPAEPLEVDPRNYRMVLAGDILIGLSGGGMVAMAVGLGIRSDAITQRQAQTVANLPDEAEIDRQEQRIRTGAVVATIGGVSAAALLSSGITLVALGYRRERLRRMSLPRAAFGPDRFVLQWTLRF